jgi:hypothetical protein
MERRINACRPSKFRFYGNPARIQRTLLNRGLGKEAFLENALDPGKDEKQMLWTIFVILLVLWLVGLVSFHAIGAYIHILLVLAIVVLLIQLISGRRRV